MLFGPFTPVSILIGSGRFLNGQSSGESIEEGGDPVFVGFSANEVVARLADKNKIGISAPLVKALRQEN